MSDDTEREMTRRGVFYSLGLGVAGSARRDV